MKKILALLLCLVIAFSVVGCGKDKGEDAQTGAAAEQTTGAEENDATTEEPAEEDIIIEGISMDMIDEFNTTDDPARKEELGKIIGEVLKRAEEAAEKKGA